MKKFTFWIVILLFVLAVSCKKSEVTPVIPVKFMSLTTGSTWDYRLVDSSSVPVSSSDYTLTASSRDTTINAKTYKVFTSTSGTNEYYNITGNDYYTFRKLPASLGSGFIEVLYLKANLNVGETWSQTSPISVVISGFPLSLNLTFNNKIAQKGITKIVNGISYTNVTEVATTLAVTGIPVANSLISDVHYFFAPNVGQIQNTTILNFTVSGFPSTNFNTLTSLLSSHIL